MGSEFFTVLGFAFRVDGLSGFRLIRLIGRFQVFVFFLSKVFRISRA